MHVRMHPSAISLSVNRKLPGQTQINELLLKLGVETNSTINQPQPHPLTPQRLRTSPRRETHSSANSLRRLDISTSCSYFILVYMLLIPLLHIHSIEKCNYWNKSSFKISFLFGGLVKRLLLTAPLFFFLFSPYDIFRRLRCHFLPVEYRCVTFLI